MIFTALQEFLASYAVKVDESGVRRLKSVLEENRKIAAQVSSAFAGAKSAIGGLFSGENSNSASRSFQTLISDLALNAGDISGSISSARDYLTRGLGAETREDSVSRAISDLTVDARDLSGSLTSVRNFLVQPMGETPKDSFLESLSSSLESLKTSLDEDLISLSLSPSIDLSQAEESANSFVVRLESLRPKLSVNTSGITSAVSSAVSSIRSMLAAVSITVPVKAVASVEIADPADDGDGNGSNSGGDGSERNGIVTGSGSPSGLGGGSTPQYFAEGGRVTVPTLAMVGEKSEPEYIIPVQDESRALPLLRSLLDELSDKGRAQLIDELSDSGRSPLLNGLNDSGRAQLIDGLFDSGRSQLLDVLSDTERLLQLQDLNDSDRSQLLTGFSKDLPESVSFTGYPVKDALKYHPEASSFYKFTATDVLKNLAGESSCPLRQILDHLQTPPDADPAHVSIPAYPESGSIQSDLAESQVITRLLTETYDDSSLHSVRQPISAVLEEINGPVSISGRAVTGAQNDLSAGIRNLLLESADDSRDKSAAPLLSAFPPLFPEAVYPTGKSDVSDLFNSGFQRPALPEFKLPEFEFPEYAFPEFNLPELEVPEYVFPELNLPELEVPEYALPELNLPELEVPEYAFPEFNLPELEVPEYALPVPELNLSKPEFPAISSILGLSPFSTLPDYHGLLSDSTLPQLPQFPALPSMPAILSGSSASISDTLAALTSSAREQFYSGQRASAPVSRRVDAPVNINVTSPAASPEEVGRSVYDLAQRHLLRTMRGVFS